MIYIILQGCITSFIAMMGYPPVVCNDKRFQNVILLFAGELPTQNNELLVTNELFKHLFLKSTLSKLH